MMIAYEESESSREKISEFINQLKHEIETLFRKLERILIKLYRLVEKW